MNRKGTGYTYELLFAVFMVILLATFYMKDFQAAMPPILLMGGGLMILGGMMMRESLVIAGGIVLFGVALVYSEAVL